MADQNTTAVVKVRVERRGGLAGLRLSAEHDYALLKPAQREALASLATAASGPLASAGADRFHYRVHLTQADGSERTIEVPESAMPETLESLARAAPLPPPLA